MFLNANTLLKPARSAGWKGEVNILHALTIKIDVRKPWAGSGLKLCANFLILLSLKVEDNSF